MGIEHLTIDEHADAIKNKLVLIDFYAVWCGPCMRISPKLEVLSKKYENVKFLKVNVDEEKKLTSKYDIKCMPTFVFLQDGKIVARIEGANTKEIEGKLEELSLVE